MGFLGHRRRAVALCWARSVPPVAEPTNTCPTLAHSAPADRGANCSPTPLARNNASRHRVRAATWSPALNATMPRLRLMCGRADASRNGAASTSASARCAVARMRSPSETSIIAKFDNTIDRRRKFRSAPVAVAASLQAVRAAGKSPDIHQHQAASEFSKQLMTSCGRAQVERRKAFEASVVMAGLSVDLRCRERGEHGRVSVA